MIGTKKGQAGAAVLVALLAILIILYVLFLPPQDRAALLGEGQAGPGTPGVDNVLFSTPVGRVFLPGMPAQDHQLPSVAVRTVEEGTVLAKADQMTVSNNVFEKAPGQMLFTADPMLARNVVLSFNLASGTSNHVIVTHNGNTIFNQDVNTRSIAPIALPITQTYNNISFSASSVGFAFWRTNKYTLTNVMVTGDIKDISAATARQTFALSGEEYALLEEAQLQFIPVCNREGSMLIMLNGEEIFSGAVDCGSRNTLEIAPGKLQAGENTISFSTRDGDFIIDNGALLTKGKQQQNRIFRFNIDPAAVQGRQVSLRIMFADANEHTGSIILNGNTIPLRAQDIVTVPVTQYLRAGENTLQFEAATKEFEVVKLDVLRS